MKNYNERLRAAVIAVLDDESAYSHGTLYDRILDVEVTKLMHGDFETPDLFLGEFSRDEERSTEKLLETSPRGTWAIINLSFTYTDGTGEHREIYRGLVSSGDGKVHGRYDSNDTRPDFKTSVEHLTGMEIYTMRHKVEDERRIESQCQSVVDNRFRVGDIYRNVTVRSPARHTFSTLQITAVDGLGIVTMRATKRGSSKQFNVTLSATYFVSCLKESGQLRVNAILEMPAAVAA